MYSLRLVEVKDRDVEVEEIRRLSSLQPLAR